MKRVDQIREGLEPTNDIVPLNIFVDCVLHQEAAAALGIVPHSIIQKHFDNETFGISEPSYFRTLQLQCTAKALEEIKNKPVGISAPISFEIPGDTMEIIGTELGPDSIDVYSQE